MSDLSDLKIEYTQLNRLTTRDTLAARRIRFFSELSNEERGPVRRLAIRKREMIS